MIIIFIALKKWPILKRQELKIGLEFECNGLMNAVTSVKVLLSLKRRPSNSSVWAAAPCFFHLQLLIFECL